MSKAENKAIKTDLITHVQHNHTQKKQEENARQYIRNKSNGKPLNRIKRFWKEWGVTKTEILDFITIILMFGILAMLYILLSTI